jgi:hypothetical protein
MTTHATGSPACSPPGAPVPFTRRVVDSRRSKARHLQGREAWRLAGRSQDGDEAVSASS